MNFQIVKTIYRKEMLDMFRDRRALISMIVVPIIAMPGLFSILHYFTENLGKKAEKESVRIGVSANVSKAGVRDALTKAGFELVSQNDGRSAVEKKTVAASLDQERETGGGEEQAASSDPTRRIFIAVRMVRLFAHTAAGLSRD